MSESDCKFLGKFSLFIAAIYLLNFCIGYEELYRQILCLIAIPIHVYLGLMPYPKILNILHGNWRY